MTKKPTKQAKDQNPVHKEGQGVPSPEVPATSIPRRGAPKGRKVPKPLNITMEQVWEIYMSFPDDDVSPKQVHEAMIEKGLIASYAWVHQKIGLWQFPRKRAMATAGASHPADFDENKIKRFLDKLGTGFNPATTIPGVQTRLLAIVSSKMDTATPDWVQGMLKAYGVLTDELHRSYQFRMGKGEDLPQPATRAEYKPENVTPFKKKGST